LRNFCVDVAWAGQQRVEVEPLLAETPDGQPVLAEVADERVLSPGANVSITVLGDFAKFWAKNGRFS
jgi:hypothetical protein